ncbi:MAG: ribonuclease HII [Actinomycetota bacterium]
MSSKTFPTLHTEAELFAAGNRFVIGIDEVGRGAIAGPVAVGLAILDSQQSQLRNWPESLQDSKLMTERSREGIESQLKSWVRDSAVGLSSNEEIDRHGIVAALALAASRGLTKLLEDSLLAKELAGDGAVILLDGSHDWLGSKSRGLAVQVQVKADTHCVSVAAASVIAKLERDRLMRKLDEQHPGYGLSGHKGYASAAHIKAIRELGPASIHRISWLSKILPGSE